MFKSIESALPHADFFGKMMSFPSCQSATAAAASMFPSAYYPSASPLYSASMAAAAAQHATSAAVGGGGDLGGQISAKAEAAGL